MPGTSMESAHDGTARVPPNNKEVLGPVGAKEEASDPGGASEDEGTGTTGGTREEEEGTE